MRKDNRTSLLRAALAERILVLDGAMGTMLQSFHLTEEDFRTGFFEQHDKPLKGDNDVLCLTRPDAVRHVHCLYLEAGADIIETDSFNANTVSQREYGLSDRVYDMARAAASVAASAAAEYTAKTPDKPRFVAGSIGPTGSTLSMSPDVSDPGARDLSFDELAAAYTPAVEGLIDGGADILLIETVFDTLNAKAAIYAISNAFEKRDFRIPVMVSGTVSDASGRLLAGQSAEAFLISVLHAPELLSVGFNCALGPEEMRIHVEELAAKSPVMVSSHPNAGLPDDLGRYLQTPEHMAEVIAGFARDGLVNIVGGCCGTNPDHIWAIARAVTGIPPRRTPAFPPKLRLAGLDPLVENEAIPFLNVGERTNVAGSRKFLKLIKTADWNAALRIARDQVAGGAAVIDVNMDDAMLDSAVCMETFLRNLAADPDIARVPVMVDSSRFPVILAGLKCLQGKGIVNSISLKEGEAPFLEKARAIRKLGAAVLAMAFDENGQADTVDRRVSVCRRMFRLLTEQAGFAPEDIIFDPNVFAIATGMTEHDNYARDFIEAVRLIKQEMPRCHVSGGISNVSFSFRGNEPVRGALHSVFLYHAVAAGLDMGIVNPAQLAVYESIDPALRQAAENVILNRGDHPADRLLALAAGIQAESPVAGQLPAWRTEPLEKRITHALIHGDDSFLKDDLAEALAQYPQPVAIIEGPLMDAMREAGKLFAAGKMFLPQVVKTARTMKSAVEILSPALHGAQAARSAGTVILATVKGDVHDIGKNIVSVILRCNNYRVIDLGVMTPPQTILDTAVSEHADVIALSGLITPSLAEMEHIASEMERRGMSIPLFVGGATTSEAHAARKLQPLYSGLIVHTRDASQIVPILNDLMNPDRRTAAESEIRTRHAALMDSTAPRAVVGKLSPLDAARHAVQVDFSQNPPATPNMIGVRTVELPVRDLLPYIDWNAFLRVWSLAGHRDAASTAERDVLLRDARAMLDAWAAGSAHARGVVGIFSAIPHGEQVSVQGGGVPVELTFPRRLIPLADGTCPSLVDYLAAEHDHLGMFVVTAGRSVTEAVESAETRGDEYAVLVAKLLGDRLAEAAAEKLHELVRRTLWGYAPDESLTPAEECAGKYIGIRPAPGYPACPDHALKRPVFALLDAEKTLGVRLTESDMMVPAHSVCGFYLTSPAARYFAV